MNEITLIANITPNMAVSRLNNIIADPRVSSIDIDRLPNGNWTIEYLQPKLSDSDIAFMASFKDRCDQYDVTDQNILDYLYGNECGCFEGYTQLADAYNMWQDALEFAKTVV
jgi:hypothetical protein